MVYRYNYGIIEYIIALRNYKFIAGLLETFRKEKMYYNFLI